MRHGEVFTRVRDRIAGRTGPQNFSRLSRATGFCISHLSKVWHGHRRASFVAAYLLAHAADVTMEEYFEATCANETAIGRQDLRQMTKARIAREKRRQEKLAAEKKVAVMTLEHKRTPLK